MKRQLFSCAVLSVLILFAPFNASFKVYGQGGDGKLTPDPKPTPTPKGGKGAKPAAPVTPTLSFNEEEKGRFDPRAAEKFEEFLLAAKSSDWLTFKLTSENPALNLQLFDKDKTEIPLSKDAASGEFKVATASGALPADGEYRVRVTGPGTGRTAIPFTLKANRLGLLTSVYNERFQKIVLNYREEDQAAADEAVNKLEELVKEDANRASTFEMLGIIYLYNKHDYEKAEQAMAQAIKLNGAAVVKITYDAQWRRVAKLRTGKFGWEEARTGWLRIRPGQLVLTDPSNKSLASLNGQQIRELSKIVTATSYMVSITAENMRRPFIFAPASLQSAEADLVVKLIQNHVMGKTN